MEITSFDQWLDTLTNALERAESAGMTDQLIARSAAQLGDFLAESVEPDAPENRLLKEMWGIADDQEQAAIASLMIKLVRNRKRH